MGTARGKKKGSARDSNRKVVKKKVAAKKAVKKKKYVKPTVTMKKASTPTPPPNEEVNRSGEVRLKVKELTAITKRCPIIGICGPAGCGKGTAADYISAYYGYRGTSFATPLRKAVAEIFSLPRDLVFTEIREKKEGIIEFWGLSLRQMLQGIGTEVARTVHKEVWIKNMELRTKEYRDLNMGIVIDDMRFDNEAQWVRDNGGKVIHMTGPTDKDGTKHTEHASEAGVEKKPEDIVLVNNGTVAALKSTLDLIMVEQKLAWKLDMGGHSNVPVPNTEKEDEKPPTDWPEHVDPPVYKSNS